MSGSLYSSWVDTVENYTIKCYLSSTTNSTLCMILCKKPPKIRTITCIYKVLLSWQPIWPPLQLPLGLSSLFIRILYPWKNLFMLWYGNKESGEAADNHVGAAMMGNLVVILLEYTEDSVYRWRCWNFGNFWSLFCWVIWIHGILVHFLRATRGDMWRVSSEVSVTYTGLENSSCVIAADPSLMYLYRASVVYMNGYLIGKKFVILFLNIM